MKLYQLLLSIIALMICPLCMLTYGWRFYASVAGHEGLAAEEPIFYKNTTQQEFDFYNFFVAGVATFIVVLILSSLLRKQWKKLNDALAGLSFLRAYFLCAKYT